MKFSNHDLIIKNSIQNNWIVTNVQQKTVQKLKLMTTFLFLYFSTFLTWGHTKLHFSILQYTRSCKAVYMHIIKWYHNFIMFFIYKIYCHVLQFTTSTSTHTHTHTHRVWNPIFGIRKSVRSWNVEAFFKLLLCNRGTTVEYGSQRTCISYRIFP
jgi:hypothetical protein